MELAQRPLMFYQRFRPALLNVYLVIVEVSTLGRQSEA